MVALCRFFTLFILLFALPTQKLHSNFISDVSSDPVKFEIFAEEETIKPGQPFWVAALVKVDKEWHSYWKNPGDAGMPLTLQWDLPEGFRVGTLEWPFPQRFVSEGNVTFGYDGDVVLLTQITPPENISPSEITLNADLRWVVCSDTSCLPGSSEATLSLPISQSKPGLNSLASRLFKEARSKIPKKTATLTAERKKGVIEIVLPEGSKELFTQAYFCPESPAIIDHKADALLSTNHSSITLKTSTDSDDSSNLRGILVLRKDGQVQAIDVDTAINPNGEIASTLPSGKAATAYKLGVGAPDPSDELSHEFQGGFWLALGFAFLGGMILNLMPCVLPVVSFKILSFVKMAGKSRSLTMKYGLSFSMGVLVSFWALAGMLLVLQSYGNAVGWGFQLQEPIFVAVLAAVLLIFGLSSFGLFEFGTLFASWMGTAGAKKQEGYTGSFFSGVLATAVATPCTGPFLGTAVGFAVTLPAPLALLIFTSLGLGMASPYLLLAACPSLLRYLPKPGAWMTTFKEIMGFVMLATVLWLLWVFSAQTSTMAVSLLLTGFFLFSVACWVHGKWGSPIKPRRTRVVATLCAFALFALGGNFLVEASSSSMQVQEKTAKDAHSDWEEFSPERIAELQSKGIPVFVDFTAKWCLICQANHLVLSVSEVDKRMHELGVVKMKADWTKSDPIITKELRKYGRNGVPLYLLYGKNPNDPPQILPQVLSPKRVIDYLDTI